jgi:prevent-host-death family protein
MITLALNPANTELAFLIDQIEHGETVTVTKNGLPVAQILPFQVQAVCVETPNRFIGKWPIGLLKNQQALTPDFDEPLPDDLIETFEGKENHAR